MVYIVVSQPEAGEVLPEEASENGYPPTGESGEVENYASGKLCLIL